MFIINTTDTVKLKSQNVNVDFRHFNCSNISINSKKCQFFNHLIMKYEDNNQHSRLKSIISLTPQCFWERCQSQLQKSRWKDGQIQWRRRRTSGGHQEDAAGRAAKAGTDSGRNRSHEKSSPSQHSQLHRKLFDQF